ncbi:MAG: hypothetical protein ACYCXA_08055 [Actinomycetes bacterium]
MPAEIHQRGRQADAESIVEPLRILLSDQGDDAERTVGPKIDPGDLDPSMTLAVAANTMVPLPEGVDDDH